MSEKHYNTLSDYYKKMFNSKVFKVSLDAGFTCPNKDGKLGTGGCIFCNGAKGIGDVKKSLKEQFEEVKKILHKKWPNAKYIVYLEANTNTYGSLAKLKEIYEEVLSYEGVVGLNIGTRCDCLDDGVIDYLSELSKRTHLTIELGLQSSKEETLKLLNRHHSLEEYTNAVNRLHSKGIKVVSHIINGLPGESFDDMLNTVKYLNNLKIDGIKIHMLYIEKGTALETYYKNNPFHILTLDEYVYITSKEIEILSSDVVVHRISSGPDNDKLIDPLWLKEKFKVLNSIDRYLEENNIYQGQKRC